MFRKISLLAFFAMATSSFLMSTSIASAQEEQAGTSVAFPNGCNALRYQYGNKQASVANPCDTQGRLTSIDLSFDDPTPTPNPVAEPTEEDYNEWVEFVRANCTGGTNYNTFQSIVDRASTFFCRNLSDPISLPNPAPTYFLGGLDFYNSGGLTSLSGLDLVETIPSINAQYSGLTDLDGLRSLREINSLVLSYNNITNIDGLRSLREINSLVLSNNNLTSIDGLSNIEQINSLILNGNQLTNVSSLSNITEITTLHLNANSITDLSGLSSMHTISGQLDISYNPIENLSGLSSLTSVGEIVMAGTQVINFEGLENLSHVDNRILAWYNPNIQNFDGLDSLTELNLNVWRLYNVTDVSGLQNIARGDVSMTPESRNNITVRNPSQSPFCQGIMNGDMRISAGMYYYDFCDAAEDPTPTQAWLDYINVTCKRSSPISDLTAAETENIGCAASRPGNFPAPLPTKFGGLYFYGKGMTSLSGLDLVEEATNYLNFDQNNLSDISHLSNLKIVGDLRLGNNTITDISPLQNLESVELFYLYKNKITTVPFIPAFANAGNIDISYNEVNDISALFPLTSLQTVSFKDNNITSTQGLQNVTSVVSLDLSNNPLDDLSGVANIVSGTVELGYLADGSFTPLDNNTPFCEAIKNGSVTLGAQILSRVSAGTASLCATAQNGQWIWLNDNTISNTARTNVPAVAPSGSCAINDSYVYTPYDGTGAFGPTSTDECSSNIPYPTETANSDNISLFASEVPTDGVDNGFGVCHPANNYQCLDTTDIIDVWAITASVTEENFNNYSADARSAYLASHNLGEITRSFTIELEGQLCLNAGDRYLRKVGVNYLSYSCGGIAPAGGAIPVPDIVCDVENGIDIGEPTPKGPWLPIIESQTYSFTQTKLADQQRNVSCYEGILNTATGEIEQGDLLYEEERTLEITLSQTVQTQILISQNVLPALCSVNTSNPSTENVCAGDVFIQRGSCRFTPVHNYEYFIEGNYIKSRTGASSQPTEFTSDMTRFIEGTRDCTNQAPPSNAPQTYPDTPVTQCNGVAREYNSDNGNISYEMYWNGSLIKTNRALPDGYTSIAGLSAKVTIGEHMYFLTDELTLTTGTDKYGDVADIKEYPLCRRDYSSNFDAWINPDDHSYLTPEELEAIFFP